MRGLEGTAYFSYDKTAEDVLCYRQRHWERGSNLYGAPHMEYLGEEKFDGNLYPDGE